MNILQWLARRSLDAFESRWGYNLDYAREMLEVGGIEAIVPFQHLEKAAKYRRDVPKDVYYTAKIVATRSGDCGPCLQLVTEMARREGVADATITAVLRGDRNALPEPVQVAYDYARAVVARDGWDGPARETLAQRYGKRAIISLAYAMALGRFYPDFKYALGEAHACSRVRVGDLEVAPLPV